MATEDPGRYGVEIQADGAVAQQAAVDQDVRGFTGLLVGLAVGIVAWGLIITLFWLV